MFKPANYFSSVRYFFNSASFFTVLFTCCSLAAEDLISTDTTVDNSPGKAITPNVLARYSEGSEVAGVQSLGLPLQADLSALHQVDNSNILFSLKAFTELGPLVASKGDVLLWSGGKIERFASQSELGLSPATGIDALSMIGETLYFSTDISDSVNDTPVSDSDILAWDSPGSSKIQWSQKNCGIPDSADLAGLHVENANLMLMSFKSTATIGGVAAGRGDILRCDPDDGTVSMYRSFTDLDPKWFAIGIDAVSIWISHIIFTDSFENITN